MMIGQNYEVTLHKLHIWSLVFSEETQGLSREENNACLPEGESSVASWDRHKVTYQLHQYFDLIRSFSKADLQEEEQSFANCTSLEQYYQCLLDSMEL